MLLGVGGAEMRVERVVHSQGHFVNPVTETGFVLAAAAGSLEPVLATSHPEWSAKLLMSESSSSVLRRALDAFGLVSYAAPTAAQMLYSAVEPVLDAIAPVVASEGAVGAALGLLLKPIAVVSLVTVAARRAGRFAGQSRA